MSLELPILWNCHRERISLQAPINILPALYTIRRDGTLLLIHSDTQSMPSLRNQYIPCEINIFPAQWTGDNVLHAVPQWLQTLSKTSNRIPGSNNLISNPKTELRIPDTKYRNLPELMLYRLTPMLMETRCCKYCFQTIHKINRLKILAYWPLQHLPGNQHHAVVTRTSPAIKRTPASWNRVEAGIPPVTSITTSMRMNLSAKPQKVLKQARYLDFHIFRNLNPKTVNKPKMLCVRIVYWMCCWYSTLSEDWDRVSGAVELELEDLDRVSGGAGKRIWNLRLLGLDFKWSCFPLLEKSMI